MARKDDFASRVRSSVGRSFAAGRPNRVDIRGPLRGGFGVTSPVDEGGGGGGDYVAPAVRFGSGAIEVETLAVADSPIISYAFWQKVAPGDLCSFWYLYDASNNTLAQCTQFWNEETDFALSLLNADQMKSFFVISDPGAFGDGVWALICGSGNTNFGAGSKIGAVYKGGIDVTLSLEDASTAFSIPFLGNDFYVGKIGETMEMADFQAWVGTYIDFSNPASLEKFIVDGKPVDPAVATAAFGQQTFLFSGDAETFPVNQGVGGVAVLDGTLTNATTSPSD